MGRMYAGVLGPLAFTTFLARMLIDGSEGFATLRAAILCLFAFAAIGYIAGQIADSIIGDAVRTRFNEEMTAREKAVEADTST